MSTVHFCEKARGGPTTGKERAAGYHFAGQALAELDGGGLTATLVANTLASRVEDWTSANSISSRRAATFDQNGNQTGQIASVPTQSWFGNQYQFASTDQVLFPAMDLAASFWAFASANASGNSFAAQQNWYPQLLSCFRADNLNPPSCPGPRQVIFNAYKALAVQNPVNMNPAILVTNSVAIQQWVFNKLKAPNGGTYQIADFITYLRKGFSPFDGTISKMPVSELGISKLISNSLVEDDFKDSSLDAETMPRKTPLTVFFNPANVDTSTVSIDQGINEFNMAMVFHEGLHGFTGMTDSQLQSALGCTQQFGSINITDYVAQFLRIPPPNNPDACQ